MKKVLFSLFLFSAMAVGVQAQSACSKACAAKPAGAACESKSADASAAAAKLASTDATIETKTCPGTTAVCYVRKVSEKNGSVSYVDVTYDATSNTFVNVSPTKVSETGCSGKNASGSKACCAPGASKTKTASSTTSSHGTTTAPSKG